MDTRLPEFGIHRSSEGPHIRVHGHQSRSQEGRPGWFNRPASLEVFSMTQNRDEPVRMTIDWVILEADAAHDLSGLWSPVKAAQQLTLRLALDPSADPDLSMTHLVMDLREVLEELEWGTPGRPDGRSCRRGRPAQRCGCLQRRDRVAAAPRIAGRSDRSSGAAGGLRNRGDPDARPGRAPADHGAPACCPPLL
jgi:hypothetical protein